MASASNMYTTGEYLQKNPTWDVEDASWKANAIYRLIAKNKLQPREIVEVGCGAGGILESLAHIDKNILHLKGYDISPQAIDLAKARESERIRFYNEDFRLSKTSTELILLIDVIEHVEDCYGFLRDLRSSSSYHIFHIPLDLSCHSILKPHVLLQQRESVGHIHYFSREMVLWLLKDTGYDVVDWFYTKPVADLQGSSGLFQGLKRAVRNISFSVHKDLAAKLFGKYSMMILTKASRT